jgi:serine/threonine protein kinase
MIKSGLMQRKRTILGIWRKCNVELRHNELILKDTAKAPAVHIPLGPQTRVQYVSGAWGRRIRIQNGGKRYSFRIPDQDALAQWLMDIRSETFYNPNLSMENFELISVLGRGVFGKVTLVRDRTSGRLSAIKSIHKNSMIQSGRVHTIVSERAVLGKIQHPFITSLQFAFQSSTKFYIGLEYIPGGELLGLLTRVGRIPLDDVRIYIAEVGLALSALHSKGIVYRDLKPENILIAADGHLKLADFGLAKDISGTSTQTFCGTLDFMAPEIVTGKKYSYEIDWWALGILTYQLIFGTAPFSDANRQRQMNKILTGRPVFERDTDNHVIDFVQKLLIKDPKKRFNFENLKAHPFFENMKMSEIMEKKYTPSFVPEIRDLTTPTYFDEEFTTEPAVDSIASTSLDNQVFKGFSFLNGVALHDC